MILQSSIDDPIQLEEKRAILTAKGSRNSGS